MPTLKNLHKFYSNLFEDDKFSREKAKQSIGGYQYQGEKRVIILERLYAVILNSELADELLKLYIKNSNMTMNEINIIYKSSLDEEQQQNVKYFTARNRILYLSRKINDIFYEKVINNKNYDILQWVVDGNMFNDFNDEKREIANEFTAQIKEFVGIYLDKDTNIDRKVIIKIPKIRKPKITNIDNERFDELLEILRPYSKAVRDKMQNLLNNYEAEIGYLRYITNPNVELNDEDKERKRDILRWLGEYNEELGDSQL